ncbi:hypothetical protein [Pseudonocardia sp. TRM90224]|uniref:hypothetical protein n=1 Tax=Pseudonocardia sp. TRM90224 TaxID=2812678 RepID=UPI001E341231|nr:hypothetical protein [Pseudonocardia sp. TRM90224]
MGTARTPVFKHALPHRGDGSAPHVPAADAPARLAALVEARRERLARVAWSPKSEPELVAAAEAHLAGIASPLGAAVALPLVRRLPGAGGPTDFRCAVDAWAVEHGLGFAVDAVMAMADINGLADRFDRPEPRRLPPGAPPRLGVDADSPATALRRLLVGVGDEEHADAVERIARGRTSVTNRAVAAFLVPDRSEWVDVACAETLRHHRSASAMLLCSIGGLDQLELVKALVNPAYMVEVRTAMATLAHRLGPASAPLLVQWSRWTSPGGKRAVLNVLAHLDSDAALVGLLGHADSASGAKALASAAERFPERAVRLFAIRLADWPRNDFLARRLRDVAQGHPEAVDAVLPRLPADARAAVERQRPAGADAGADGNGNGNGNVPDAPAGTLPPVLVDPPWQGKARKKLAAVGGLVAPFERRVIWAAGERERWLQEPGGFARGSGAATDWEVYRHYEGRTFAPNWAFQLAGAVPVELLLPALPQWELGAAPAAQIEDMRYAAARLELAVLPLLLTAARQQPGLSGGALTPFLDTEVAELLASWLARPRTPQADAVEYFELHGVDAARLLVPGADGVESDLRRRLKGTTVSAGRLLALSHRGWVRRSSMELDKPLGSGGRVSFVVEPGLLWDGVVSDSEQEVVQIHLDGEPDALEASELLADLAFLTR